MAQMAHQKRTVAPCVASCVDDEHTRIFLEVEIPGVNKEDIRLTMHEDSFYLTAHREDGYLDYATSYALCCPVKAEQAEAKYENGLLKIVVPFRDAMENAININVA